VHCAAGFSRFLYLKDLISKCFSPRNQISILFLRRNPFNGKMVHIFLILQKTFLEKILLENLRTYRTGNLFIFKVKYLIEVGSGPSLTGAGSGLIF
jgi:hypothetical protein